MNILVIAPHPDDEVLGCGGTIAKYVANGEKVFVAVVTKGCGPIFSSEQVSRVREECKNADRILGVTETIFMDYPAAMLETVPRHEFNEAFTKIIQEIKPDIVFLPHHGDIQLDHKMTVDAAMVALRPKYDHVVKKVYSYETLSETGWDLPNTSNDFIPIVYNDITDYLEIKLKAMSLFESQVADYPDSRSLKAIQALALYRGSMMRIKAAEAFSLIREVIV